jgi:hypothetical protein
MCCWKWFSKGEGASEFSKVADVSDLLACRYMLGLNTHVMPVIFSQFPQRGCQHLHSMFPAAV